MSDSANLIAAIYPDREHADTIYDMLERMHKGLTITVKDAAFVTKGDGGKLEIHETRELTAAKGAVRGALITGALAIIYPPSLLVSLFGGGLLGGLIGRARDTGIKTKDMKALADQLSDERVALFVMVDDESVLATQNAMSSNEGDLVVMPIDQATMVELNEENMKREAAGE
jgi:uncharacterized membrane protein